METTKGPFPWWPRRCGSRTFWPPTNTPPIPLLAVPSTTAIPPTSSSESGINTTLTPLLFPCNSHTQLYLLITLLLDALALPQVVNFIYTFPIASFMCIFLNIHMHVITNYALSLEIMLHIFH